MATRGITGKLLGRGSYGEVSEYSIDDFKMALKIITTNSMGISAPLEISIMSTFNHPHLSSSIYTEIDRESIKIYQELAISDLEMFLRENVISNELIKQWSYQMTMGLKCLHDNDIIHCDLKPNNILIYYDSSDKEKLIVKVADFTLCRLKMSNRTFFKGDVGSLYYRSPESLSSKIWSMPIDIWGLGCIFYKMVSVKHLIPNQTSKRLNDTLMYEDMKEKTRILSCIMEWRSRSGEPTPGSTSSFVGRIDFDTPWIGKCNLFKALTFSMLSYDPNKRPTISEIRKSKYFDSMSRIEYEYSTVCNPSPPKTKFNEISKYISANNTIHPDVAKLAKSLYFRTNGIENCSLKIDTCIWIAHKMIKPTDYKLQINSQIDNLITMEAHIIKSLDYKLMIIEDKDDNFTIGSFNFAKVGSGGSPDQ